MSPDSLDTLELARYNLQASDLANASLLQQWLYWLLHAHEYESEELLRLSTLKTEKIFVDVEPIPRQERARHGGHGSLLLHAILKIPK